MKNEIKRASLSERAREFFFIFPGRNFRKTVLPGRRFILTAETISGFILAIERCAALVNSTALIPRVQFGGGEAEKKKNEKEKRSKVLNLTIKLFEAGHPGCRERSASKGAGFFFFLFSPNPFQSSERSSNDFHRERTDPVSFKSKSRLE